MPKRNYHKIDLDDLLPLPKGYSEVVDLGVSVIKKNSQGSYVRIFKTFINSKVVHEKGVYRIKMECLGVSKNV
jgi:hypothetical protein